MADTGISEEATTPPLANVEEENVTPGAAGEAVDDVSAKTPPRGRLVRRRKQASPSRKILQSTHIAVPISSPQEGPNEDRRAALERELERARRRADARGKEAASLRKRVQELEPHVRRLEQGIEKAPDRQGRTNPRPGPRPNPRISSPSPERTRTVGGDVALRGQLAAAENLAHILQLRCDQLELRQRVGPATSAAKRADGQEHITLVEDVTESCRERDRKSEAREITQQLEVAERRVKNSLYINEAHESLAVKATEREREANSRAKELQRKLDRAHEKLESIKRKDMISGLAAMCQRDEESIHLSEKELRAHQMDPELYLPVNTAKRRQLVRSEHRLRRLRLRFESQTAAFEQAQSIEQLHSNLRRAAACADVSAIRIGLESGISVNIPDEAGLSAFQYACGQANAELVQMMVDAGGDVLDGDGSITGLIIAARKGATDVVRVLLRTGANVNARDSAGGTALHMSVLRKHEDVSLMLLEAGADCNAVDHGTNTALHTIASSTTRRIANGGDGVSHRLVSLLLEWGASVTIVNSMSLTPVSAALEAKNRGLILVYRDFLGEDNCMSLNLPDSSALRGAMNSTPIGVKEEYVGTRKTETKETAAEKTAKSKVPEDKEIPFEAEHAKTCTRVSAR